MPSVERLRSELAEALPRLHDPSLDPGRFLREMVAASPEAGTAAVQARLLASIEQLQPDEATPRDSRASREYELLENRYVLGLTQEDTAERMRIGVRTVQRLQSQAIHALAVHLWQARQQREESVGPEVDTQSSESPAMEDWHTQSRQELAALSATDPEATSQVAEIIAEVLADDLTLAHAPECHVDIGFVQRGLESPIHPIALRQMLIMALRRLARHVVVPRITIYARSEEGQARVTLSGIIDPGGPPSEPDLFRDIVAPETVSLDLHQEGEALFLSLWLPATGVIRVLAVDDNADMVQFYRRCTAGSRYQILQAGSARAMFEMIESSEPDLVLLDVMLPDEDGWHVLMRLHQNPETQDIPVVVSTVIRERELALSLGAAAFLSKPIAPSHFIETLDALVRPG